MMGLAVKLEGGLGLPLTVENLCGQTGTREK